MNLEDFKNLIALMKLENDCKQFSTNELDTEFRRIIGERIIKTGKIDADTQNTAILGVGVHLLFNGINSLILDFAKQQQKLILDRYNR